jgi:hypothetical protein
MFTGGSVVALASFGRFRTRPRSLTSPARITFAGLSSATNSLAPERFCAAYVVAGASFTQYASPTGDLYGGRRRVLSKPSARDQPTIAAPIRAPSSSDLVRTAGSSPAESRDLASESARRVSAARVAGSASRRSASSTTRSAATATSVPSCARGSPGLGSSGNAFSFPASGSSVGSAAASPE